MSPSQVARNFYSLFAGGQVEKALEDYVDADAVLENPLPSPIPFGGRFIGRDGFGQYLQKILAGIAIEVFEIDEVFSDGERVTVLGRETSRVLATDKRYTMEWVHVLTVREGRIQRMREYNDTAAMLAAFS